MDFRTLFEQAPAAFLVLEPDPPRFTIAAVSDAYLQATMTTRQALVGRGIFEAFPEPPDEDSAAGASKLRASLMRAVRSGLPDTMGVQRYALRRADGSWEERYWSTVNKPVLNADDDVVCIIHHVEDVTQVVRHAEDGSPEPGEAPPPDSQALELQASLARRTQALDQARAAAEVERERAEEVVAIVSHDLRNPLHTIQLSAHLLEAPGLESAARERAVERILATTAQMDRLIQGLLDTHRLERGHELTVRPAVVETGELLREACLLFEPQIREKEIHLACDSAKQLPRVRADADRILQVFWNLIGNAVKFTPEGGRVGLEASAMNGWIQFSVRDSGPGISQEDVERLFDPFWQEKRTARLGTGLGLPITRAIVAGHGGRIWVESEPGQGSTFHFTLPVASADD